MDEVIRFEGKALGVVAGVIRDHGLKFHQAYIWYVLGYARDALGQGSTQVNTSAYAAYLGVSVRSIREGLVVLQAKGLVEKVQGGSFEAAAYRLR
jgi:hypothetical protein